MNVGAFAICNLQVEGPTGKREGVGVCSGQKRVLAMHITDRKRVGCGRDER